MSSFRTLVLSFTSRGTGILNLVALGAAAIHGGAWPVFGLLFG